MGIHGVGEMGGFMDFCPECGTGAQRAGGDQLMIDVIRKYKNDEGLVTDTLCGLTGNVYHSPDGASRVKLYELGLPALGIELMKLYPHNPPGSFLQVRQEVIAVMSGLCLDSPKQKEVRDTIMKLYPSEVFRLMEEEPTSAPSQGKSCEFIRNLATYDSAYAEAFIRMGAIQHLAWAIGNYTSPSGKDAGMAGKFWNVDASAAQAIVNLATMVPSCKPQMIQAGLVDLLIKAAKNPEGGYQVSRYLAKPTACEALRLLDAVAPPEVCA